MQVKREQISDTNVKLNIIADQQVLDQVKAAVLGQLGRDARVPGFRPGKAPANLLEKQLDAALLQTEFLDRAINHLFAEAIQHEKLRPVAQPEINVTKFVPFATLEFTAAVETVGDVTLPDYHKITLAPKDTSVTLDDVNQILDNLRGRSATKKPVTRAAKDGDEVAIDFKGTDAKTQEPIAGADGQDYPLLLGSQSFIPGFEDNLVGAKAGAVKTFTLTFPEDYGVADLRKREISFMVTVHEVRELSKPKLDDAFAATVGPFKTVPELKIDIKKQLATERQQADQRAYDSELLQKIAEKSQVAIPKVLVDGELDRMEEEERRNLTYRGQTWQEHLEQEGLTADEHREKHREDAVTRVKAGLVLAEIAEQEGLTVTPEELEVQIQLLKGRYASDTAMQAELDKPENRRELVNRLLTEKTFEKLRAYAHPKASKTKKK